MLYYKYNEGEIMIKTVRDINLNNKKVLIRCDFNVPIKDGVITDLTNRVIIVTYKDVDYRESFNIGTILSDNNIDVRVEGNWTSLKTLLLRG